MVIHPDYIIEDTIFDGGVVIIYSGVRSKDNKRVTIKSLSSEFPEPKDVDRISHEYELIKSLDAPEVIHAYALESYKHRLFLVLEEFEGSVALSTFLGEKALDIKVFLGIAIHLSKALNVLHQARIIHKDIKPQNILIRPKDLMIKIIDFGIATKLPRESQEAINPTALEGTLAYISPEQTGRMNRMIDYRTDFYSLGILFYKMLTGQLPFMTIDPMELVHCHIAKQPIPPHEVNSDVPELLSQMVMKLLSKDPEQRYGSAAGLLFDLEECLKQFKKSGKIDIFSLGEHSITGRLHIPQKLYGRDVEVKQLMSAFDNVSQGEKQILLVAGYSGVGKTMLVRELQKSILAKRGFFISGKFEQFKRTAPYLALIQAFTKLIQHILRESEKDLAVWKVALQQALEPNGQLIIDIIPDLELVIGKQPEAPELDPTGALHRFHHTFQNFTHVFSQSEHPLTLFLDNLQWADAASLRLMEVLLKDYQLKHFLLLGVYRDNEVGPTHPLMSSLKELRSAEVTVDTLKLKPLDQATVSQLLADTLISEPTHVKPLAQLIFDKTGGNPFFINAFIESIYKDELISFDSKKQSWMWDQKKIEALPITDNVVDLMTQRLERLPEMTQQVLKISACIGNQFDLETLAIVHEQDQQSTVEALQPALEEGLIYPLEKTYQQDVKTAKTQLHIVYKFQHDRVQQAAYTLIDELGKKKLQLKVGRLMLKNIKKTALDEKIFEIVNHLNEGTDLLDQQKERNQLARLNLVAGIKAKASAAYAPSFDYLKEGLKLLDKKCWKTSYDLSLALHREASEAAYLAGNFEEMEGLSDVLLKHAKTLLEKIPIYESKISAYALSSRHIDAVNTGEEILMLLGVKLPKEPKKIHIIRELLRVKFSLIRRPIEKLIDLPEMTDRRCLAAMHILSRLISSAFFAKPNLLPIISLRMVMLSIQNGNSAASAIAYAACVVIFWTIGDINSSRRFGELANKLVDKMDAKKEQPYVLAILGAFLHNWIGHLKNCLPILLASIDKGLDTGSIEYAGYSANNYSVNAFNLGMRLDDVKRETQDYSHRLKQLNQFRNYYSAVSLLQTIENLQVETENPGVLVGDYYDEKKMMPIHIKADDWTLISAIKVNKATVCYIFEDYENGLKSLAQVNIEALSALPRFSQCLFYEALSLLAIFPKKSKKEKKKILKRVAFISNKMKKWAKFAPMNFLHKYHLIRAELARVSGDYIGAMNSYDLAIENARENDYINEEAIANECAARFYSSQNKINVANSYLRDAYYCYDTWGAFGKIIAMEKKYPQLNVRYKQSALSAETTTTATMQTATATAGALDLISVVKASQVISSKLQLEQLLGDIIIILIENAGAERGLLLLEKNRRYLVEAEGTVKQKSSVLQSQPFEERSDLCQAVIQYVQRTQKMVVLQNALKEGDYTQDPYVIRNKSLSILCAPIIQKGYLIGILYLENNLTSGAFTSGRLEVLALLSGQAAISLENARLYKAYERFVPEAFLEQLGKRSIIDVELGDSTEKKISVLFADIKNFTALSETLTPAETFSFINACIHALEPVINAHGGFIDKYIGGGIMALFPRSADDAVFAGIDMLKAFEEFIKSHKRSDKIPLSIGIGINTGELMLGTIGDERHMEGSVIGDTVNLASRIQTLTKRYKTPFMISEQTRSLLTQSKQYELENLGKVRVKGKTKSTEVWSVHEPRH